MEVAICSQSREEPGRIQPMEATTRILLFRQVRTDALGRSNFWFEPLDFSYLRSHQ